MFVTNIHSSWTVEHSSDKAFPIHIRWETISRLPDRTQTLVTTLKLIHTRVRPYVLSDRMTDVNGLAKIVLLVAT